MNRFVSIYAEMLLGICSTVLLNAKNGFGHQQSKIKYDISIWSDVSWKENVTNTRKDHKAEKGREKKWADGQRKIHIKEVLLSVLYITFSSSLVFRTHRKGLCQEHDSFTSLCNELSLCYSYFQLDFMHTRNVTSHASKNHSYFFSRPLFPTVIYKLILAESFSTLSSPLLKQMGKTVLSSYCWKPWHLGCYWRPN